MELDRSHDHTPAAADTLLARAVASNVVRLDDYRPRPITVRVAPDVSVTIGGDDLRLL